MNLSKRLKAVETITVNQTVKVLTALFNNYEESPSTFERAFMVCFEGRCLDVNVIKYSGVMDIYVKKFFDENIQEYHYEQYVIYDEADISAMTRHMNQTATNIRFVNSLKRTKRKPVK